MELKEIKGTVVDTYWEQKVINIVPIEELEWKDVAVDGIFKTTIPPDNGEIIDKVNEIIRRFNDLLKNFK